MVFSWLLVDSLWSGFICCVKNEGLEVRDFGKVLFGKGDNLWYSGGGKWF